MFFSKLLLVLLASLFALSNVLLPVFFKVNYTHQALIAYGGIHLLGRIQGILLLHAGHVQRNQKIQGRSYPSFALEAEVTRRKVIQNQVFLARRSVEREASWYTLLLPNLIGLIARMVVIGYLYPEQFILALIFGLGIIVLVMGFSKFFKQHYQRQQQAYAVYEKDHQQCCYQNSILQANKQMVTLLTIQSYVYQHEFIKTLLGLLCILSLAVATTMFQDMLQCLLWVGFGDHLWGIWSGMLEKADADNRTRHPLEKARQRLQTVTLSNVWLPPLSSSVHVSLSKGDCLQIKGNNGAGKTRLLKALLGDIDFDGDIKCNGIHASCGAFDQVWVQGSQPLLAYGQIDHYIFKDSDDPFGIKPEIAKLKQGYATSLEELSMIWSQGMLQLLSLTYAYGLNPDIWLLDEACSFLSAENESNVYVKIMRLKPILIFVSHQACLSGLPIKYQSLEI